MSNTYLFQSLILSVFLLHSTSTISRPSTPSYQFLFPNNTYTRPLFFSQLAIHFQCRCALPYGQDAQGEERWAIASVCDYCTVRSDAEALKCE